MDPDPNAKVDATRPVLVRDRLLCVERCGYGVVRSSKGDEERIALPVDLVSSVRGKRSTKELAVTIEGARVLVRSEMLEQPGRAFDVRKEQSDSPYRLLRHRSIT
jgi:hypothetical protein